MIGKLKRERYDAGMKPKVAEHSKKRVVKGKERGLESIPGIGSSLAADLRLIGIKKIADLKGKNPEVLYRTLEKKTGGHQDRCVLYTFRCATYFS